MYFLLSWGNFGLCWLINFIHSSTVTQNKCSQARASTTSAFRVQLYIHAIQRGQLVSLRLRDGYGGHCGDDLLFFFRLLRCVCVDYRDLPVGHPARGGTTVGWEGRVCWGLGGWLERIKKVNGNSPSGLFH